MIKSRLSIGVLTSVPEEWSISSFFRKELASPSIINTVSFLPPTVVTDASGSRTFRYNQYGELESEQTTGLVESIVTLNRDVWGRTSGYSLKHKETALNTVTPAYDAASNQTLIRTVTVTWNAQHNAANRTTFFQQGDRRIDSVYDFMGRRIEKAAWEKTTLTKRLRSTYHGYVQIAEIDATDETAPYVTKTYRWAPSEPVATRPLALTLWTREGTARETLYYAHDLRKNVVSLFDAKGLRRASYQYDPYGNITSMEGDMAEENPFRFSSEHHDEGLGLACYNYHISAVSVNATTKDAWDTIGSNHILEQKKTHINQNLKLS